MDLRHLRLLPDLVGGAVRRPALGRAGARQPRARSCPERARQPADGCEGHRDHHRLGRDLGHRLVRHRQRVDLPADLVSPIMPDTPPVPTSYCDVAPDHPWHGPYHEREYGFPITDEQALFERLILEINQAGLSWLTILKKREAFQRAYHGFDVDRIARYGERDRARLLADAGIIRNKLKVNAAIENAKRVQVLRRELGSLADWIAG